MSACLTCGGNLDRVRRDARYCSAACRTAGYRARRGDTSPQFPWSLLAAHKRHKAVTRTRFPTASRVE
jgi:hypothetical protein